MGSPFARRWIISIHALHEESDFFGKIIGRRLVISIHALHEESDLSRPSMTCSASIFQSTLSMRRATTTSTPKFTLRVIFQSTLSMRRATLSTTTIRSPFRFQSTLSMRRATGNLIDRGFNTDISIHALHEESDMS